MTPLGASTACFYPMDTEKALESIGALGFQQTEIFFNSPSELSDTFAAELNAVRKHYGIQVISIHPFTSFAESFFLFSAYHRRYTDGLEFYKRYFDTANRIGASIAVIHGGKAPLTIAEEEYFERFGRLAELGAAQGIAVAQENVVHFLSESPSFLSRMRTALGSKFHMVLDIKQAVRTGLSPFSLIDQFGESIVHIHLSDHNAAQDCLPVGEGTFDLKKLFTSMQAFGYRGSYIMELYRGNFQTTEQLVHAREYWESMQKYFQN